MSSKNPRTPLLDPEAYFRHTNVRVAHGVGVFVLYVIIINVYLWAALQLISAQAERTPPEFDQAMTDGGVAVVFVFTVALLSVVALFLIAGVMHVFCSKNSEEGGFSDAVAIAGWAYAPNILSVPVMYLYIRHVLGQRTLNGSDPAALDAELSAAQIGGTGPVWVAISLVVVIWSVYILAYGAARAYDVDVEEAVIPAIIVGVGAFLFGVL